MRWLVMTAAVALLACPGGAAVCEQLRSRCDGNVAQVCNSHGRWEPVMDCDQVEGQDMAWACGMEEEEATCLPVEEVAP